MWRPDRTLWGYLLINGSTFALDLGLLTVLHGQLHWPLPAAITVSYATAFAASYALNRTLNFRSHAPLGRQLRVYAAVVALNYLVWILGVADALTALGLEYQLARVAAGACEAVYMYLALRWLVFRSDPTRRDSEVASP